MLYNVRIMFIRQKSSPNSTHKTVQIVESIRKGTKVSQHIVQYIGAAENEEELRQLLSLAQSVKEALEKERGSKQSADQSCLFTEDELSDSTLYLSSEMDADASGESVVSEGTMVDISAMENLRTCVDGPFEVMERLSRLMCFSDIFGNTKRDTGKMTLLKQLMAGMLVNPSSKRGISRWLSEYYEKSPSLDAIYRFMDAISDREDRIKKTVQRNSSNLIGEGPTLILYDVTTLYFESFEEDAIRQSGFSKDNKFRETQIVLALAATPDGLPLWYEVYPGKTAEGKTFMDYMQKMPQLTARARAGLASGRGDVVCRGVIAADSAMFNSINIEELKKNGCSFVLGGGIKKRTADEKAQMLDMTGYKELQTPKPQKSADKVSPAREEDEVLKYKVIERKDGTRLLVTWSSQRARKDSADRKRLIDRVRDKLTNGKINGTKLTGNRGTMKYLRLNAGEHTNSYILSEEKIAQDAQWDGLHGIVTDLPLTTEKEVRTALSHYHSLWHIEESFRIGKSDLKIRPVFHWTEKRIRAHISLCYLVFACLRRLEKLIELKTKSHMSPAVIREAILGVTSSLLEDKNTGRILRFPKRIGENSKRLYKALDLKYDTKPKEVTDPARYSRRIREALPKEKHSAGLKYIRQACRRQRGKRQRKNRGNYDACSASIFCRALVSPDCSVKTAEVGICGIKLNRYGVADGVYFERCWGKSTKHIKKRSLHFFTNSIFFIIAGNSGVITLINAANYYLYCY